MHEFLVCPKCGDPDERRTSCKRCGYVAKDRTAGGARSAQRSFGSFLARGIFGWIGGKVAFVVILIGLAMIVGGCREYRLGAGTSAAPQDVDLAALEAGGPRPQNYVRIGKHFRLYDETLQVTRTDKKTNATTREDVYYYPIVSAEHPLIKGAAKDAPAKRVETFAVLVRHKGPLNLKAGTQPSDSIQGLIVSDIDSLEDGGEALLRTTFPKFDSSRVLILEEGAKPTEPLLSFVLMGGGALIILATIALYFARRASRDDE